MTIPLRATPNRERGRRSVTRAGCARDLAEPPKKEPIPATATSRVLDDPASRGASAYADGILAGLVGAATIALWFLALDSLHGRPFYTPTVLGTALFRTSGLEALPSVAPDVELVLGFTWVHVLAFLLIGVAASRLLELVEFNPSFGFGAVLFFVLFEFGFVAASMAFAEPVLRGVAWSEVLVGNLLAAGAMATVFWRRHPHLPIEP